MHAAHHFPAASRLHGKAACATQQTPTGNRACCSHAGGRSSPTYSRCFIFQMWNYPLKIKQCLEAQWREQATGKHSAGHSGLLLINAVRKLLCCLLPLHYHSLCLQILECDTLPYTLTNTSTLQDSKNFINPRGKVFCLVMVALNTNRKKGKNKHKYRTNIKQTTWYINRI